VYLDRRRRRRERVERVERKELKIVIAELDEALIKGERTRKAKR